MSNTAAQQEKQTMNTHKIIKIGTREIALALQAETAHAIDRVIDITGPDFYTRALHHRNDGSWTWDLADTSSDEAGNFISAQCADPDSELNQAIAAFCGARVEFTF